MLKTIIFPALFIAAFFSCQQESSETISSADLEAITLETRQETRAYVTYEGLAFRKSLNPKDNKDYYPPLELSEEVYVMEAGLKDAKNVPLTKIKRAEGKQEEGYASEYFIAQNAKMAVVTQPSYIYTGDSRTKLSKRLAPAMSLIAIHPHEQNDGLVSFQYANNGYQVKGYIETKALTYSENDIKAALYYYLGLHKQDIELRVPFLEQAAAENPSPSLAAYIRAALEIQQGDAGLLGETAMLQEPLKVKTDAKNAVNYRAEPNMNALILGSLPPASDVELTYATASEDRAEGISDLWYLAKSYGWIFGAGLQKDGSKSEAVVNLDQDTM